MDQQGISMDQHTKTPVVPEQHEGAESFTSSEKLCDSNATAYELFQRAREKLLHINRWKKTAGGGALFQLTDMDGSFIERKPREGDYIRITIPGVPETRSGSGSEWVRIERFEEEKTDIRRAVSITVRPASCPTNNEPSTAHFFTGDATSTFRVEQDGKLVRAMVIGKNEKPNTDTNTFFEKVRNVLVGLAAMAGFNKPQWKMLVNGLVSK